MKTSRISTYTNYYRNKIHVLKSVRIETRRVRFRTLSTKGTVTFSLVSLGNLAKKSIKTWKIHLFQASPLNIMMEHSDYRLAYLSTFGVVGNTQSLFDFLMIEDCGDLSIYLKLASVLFPVTQVRFSGALRRKILIFDVHFERS